LAARCGQSAAELQVVVQPPTTMVTDSSQADGVTHAELSTLLHGASARTHTFTAGEPMGMHP